MKVKEDRLILQCVEDGVAIGLRLAKEDPDNSAETTEAYIVSAVMAKLSEWFSFSGAEWD